MSLEDWAANTRNVAIEWSSIFSEAASNPRIVEIFLKKKLNDWKDLVANRFDSDSRKQLVSIKNKNLRSQILRAVVSITDLTRNLDEKGEDPEGVGDTMLRIRATLDRLVKNIDRLAAGNPEIKSALEENPTNIDEAQQGRRSTENATASKHPKTLPPPLPEARKEKTGDPQRPGCNSVGANEERTGIEVCARKKKHQLSVPDDVSPEYARSDERNDKESFAEEVVSDDQVIEELPVEEGSAADGVSTPEESVNKQPEIDSDIVKEPAESSSRKAEDSSPDTEAHEAMEEEVEIQSVDLLKDADVLEQPVIRLTKKRGESVADYEAPEPAPAKSEEAIPVESGKNIPAEINSMDTADSVRLQNDAADEAFHARKPKTFVAEDARLTLLELYLKSLRSQETLQIEQMLTLDQVVTILGGSLAGKPEELIDRISRLDKIYTSSDEPSIHETFPTEWKKILDDLCRTILETLFKAWSEASPAGLELQTTDISVVESASELPVVKLERSLRLGLAKWRLPNFLNRLAGPAVGFSCSIKAKKGIPLSRPVPENRLDFSLVAETEGIYVQALHLLEPGEEAPLGIAADPGIHAGGVFFQIMLPSTAESEDNDRSRWTKEETERKNKQLAGRFAVSETSRFLRHLEKYPRG